MPVPFAQAAAMPLLAGGSTASAGTGLMSALGGPVGLALGGLQLGLGLLQADSSAKAQQQQYLNQKALNDASTQFNNWQAGFNARVTNANNQYQYWAQTVNWNADRAYTAQLRNYDLSQEIAQAERVRDTRAGAQAEYLVNSEAIQQRFAEEGMQRAVAMQQAQYRILQQSSAFQAAALEGNSSDRIVNNYARQMGDYATLSEINEGLSKRQYKRDQLSQITNYLGKYNSQDFFRSMPRADAPMPFAPLPSLVTPAGPSFAGSAPSGTSALNIGTAVAGGVNTALSFGTGVKKLF